MSPREKNLLILFSVAGFVILNVLAFRFATGMRTEVDTQRTLARQKLEQAEMFRTSSEQVLDEMTWLEEHDPEPTPSQDIQTSLQQLAEREAKNQGLTIKAQKPLKTDDTEGRIYHRAKIQMTVTGTEEALYRWFDRLNVPTDFRIASQIRLSPNTQDDTKIDCTATIEKWFVPPSL